MSNILKKLKGGDLRSKGRSEEVVEEILKDPDLFGAVFEGMLDKDPVVRMRSADTIEKVSAKHPEYLQPFKERLINEVSKVEQQEVRWHTAQMISYLDVTKKEQNRIFKILKSWFRNPGKSKIVQVFAMQAMADIAEKDRNKKPEVLKIIKEALQSGAPAMKSRAKKLLTKLS